MLQIAAVVINTHIICCENWESDNQTQEEYKIRQKYTDDPYRYNHGIISGSMFFHTKIRNSFFSQNREIKMFTSLFTYTIFECLERLFKIISSSVRFLVAVTHIFLVAVVSSYDGEVYIITS